MPSGFWGACIDKTGMCVCVHMYIYIYISIYTYTYQYIYIYTYVWRIMHVGLLDSKRGSVHATIQISLGGQLFDLKAQVFAPGRF